MDLSPSWAPHLSQDWLESWLLSLDEGNCLAAEIGHTLLRKDEGAYHLLECRGQ
jgi:hypothetical protein